MQTQLWKQWHMPIVSVRMRQRQKEQKFKVIFVYTARKKLTWATWQMCQNILTIAHVRVSHTTPIHTTYPTHQKYKYNEWCTITVLIPKFSYICSNCKRKLENDGLDSTVKNTPILSLLLPQCPEYLSFLTTFSLAEQGFLAQSHIFPPMWVHKAQLCHLAAAKMMWVPTTYLPKRF